MGKISKELVGASSVMIILSLLEKGDSYGYDIVKKVQDLSEGRVKWTAASIYPILKKLETQNIINSYWVIGENQRPRRFYKLLPIGKELLLKEKEAWSAVVSVIDKL